MRCLIDSVLEQHWDPESQLFADFELPTEKEQKKFILHKGYVALFPLLLGLIPVDSPKLNSVLDLISDENELWSPYGVRSLSVNDSYFGTGIIEFK